MANFTGLQIRTRLDHLFARSWAGFCAVALAIVTAACSFGGHGGGHGGGGNLTGGGPLALPDISTLPVACGSATVGTNYTCQVTASGGTLPYTWTVTGLPNGLSFSASVTTMTVTVSGIPTAQDVTGGRATTYTLTLCVSDPTGAKVCLGTQAIQPQITVIPAQGPGPLTITTPSPLPNATVGTFYSSPFMVASGGTAPYAFSLASGSNAPPGLALTSSNQGTNVSGTPTTAGTYQFTINVTDSANPPAQASKAFTLTVNTTAAGCPANPGNSLCGLYWFGVRGFNASNGPTALGGSFSVDHAGNFSGEVLANDSVTGYTSITVTGGSFTMDASGDGRGVVTLNSPGGEIASFRFVLGGVFQNPIEEFETSGPRLGIRAQGFLVGPETAPVTPIPGNTILAVNLVGANGSSQKAGLLGLFVVGANGCDGSNGSFNSFEPFVTNTAGTVHTALTGTGSCTAPDANGVGTAQFTITGGSPYTNNTLHFTYVVAVTGGTLQKVLFIEKDAIGANQPLLVSFATVNTFFGLSFGGFCPCIFSEQGTVDGTINAHTAIASITRFTSTGTTATGTLSGVIDQNAASTLTTQAGWAYTNYDVDGNGVGTFTGSGQKNIDVILGGGEFWSMDESAEVRTGVIIEQNSTAVSGGHFGSVTGGPTTAGVADLIGVVGFTGAASGSITGTTDFINTSNQFPGASLSGSFGAPNYISVDINTGRGTGNVTLTSGANNNSSNVVIYATRHVVTLVLDMQSKDPDVLESQ